MEFFPVGVDLHVVDLLVVSGESTGFGASRLAALARLLLSSHAAKRFARAYATLLVPLAPAWRCFPFLHRLVELGFRVAMNATVMQHFM